jgi:hypothetical protein
MDFDRKPAAGRYPRLSDEEKKALLRELREQQDDGALHYKSRGYPSLGEKPTVH